MGAFGSRALTSVIRILRLLGSSVSKRTAPSRNGFNPSGEALRPIQARSLALKQLKKKKHEKIIEKNFVAWNNLPF